MILIRVNYTEPDPSTYAGIQLQVGMPGHPLDGDAEVFCTGHGPTVDFLHALSVLRHTFEDAGQDLEGIRITATSSVDHFVMDGGVLNDSGDWTGEEVLAASKATRAYFMQRAVDERRQRADNV